MQANPAADLEARLSIRRAGFLFLRINKMFKAIKSLSAAVKKIDQKKIMASILNESEMKKKIVALNQNQLYEEGLQADGTPTGDYAYNTIHGTKSYPGKIEKGQRYDHVTLKDTGKFYDSMKVKAVESGIVIEADDPNSLQERWPKDLGLTPESLGEIIPEVRMKFLNTVKEKIKA